MSTGFNLDDIKVTLVRTYADGLEFLEWLKQGHNLMGFDVETSGLNFMEDKLRLVQFGTLNEAYAVPFEWFPGLVKEALELLDKMNTPLVGHNVLFDIHFVEQNTGWTPAKTSWNRIHNTLFLAAVVDSSGSKALKDLSVHYISPIANLGQKMLHDEMKKGGWGWGDVPVELDSYWIYGCLDTILTVHLFWILHKKAVANGSITAYEIERAAAPVIYQVEKNGMTVDADHCHRQIDNINQRNAEIETHVASQYGIENIGSSLQLIRAFQDAGIELITRTESGKQWAMNADALDEIVGRTQHPLPVLVHEYRHGMKMRSSYFENFLKFQCSDGKVHPQYKQTQARTGRMSATNPAIQTLPRGGTDPQIRDSFVAQEGHLFLSTDFSNVEARIFASFAQEEGMLGAIRDGIDLHCYTAKEIYNLAELPPKDSPQRQIAKNVLFCRLFGGGAAKVAWTAGVPLSEAERALEGFKSAFPGIKNFQKIMSDMARDNFLATDKAFIQLPDGRIVSLNEGDDKFYVFTNYLIQGYAASLMKKRLAVIDNMGLKDYIVAIIHDEVVAEVPVDILEDYKREIEEAMNDDSSLLVPIVAETGSAAERLGGAK